MSFIYASDEQDRSQLVLSDEPSYVISLPTAPSALENCLKQGNWLVVSMALWSIHDLKAGRRAIDWAQRHRREFRLAMRLFDYPEEFLTWLPDALDHAQQSSNISVTEEDDKRHLLIQQNPHSSPIWAIFRSGKTERIAFGRLTIPEIENFAHPER